MPFSPSSSTSYHRHSACNSGLVPVNWTITNWKGGRQWREWVRPAKTNTRIAQLQDHSARPGYRVATRASWDAKRVKVRVKKWKQWLGWWSCHTKCLVFILIHFFLFLKVECRTPVFAAGSRAVGLWKNTILSLWDSSSGEDECDGTWIESLIWLRAIEKVWSHHLTWLRVC